MYKMFVITKKKKNFVFMLSRIHNTSLVSAYIGLDSESLSFRILLFVSAIQRGYNPRESKGNNHWQSIVLRER
jgi:hypothetical protein